MVGQVCRARPAECPPFGRVLELTESVGAGEDVIREPPAVLVDQPRTQKFIEDVRGHYAMLTKEEREFVATLASHPEMGRCPVPAALPPEVDHFSRVLKANAHPFGAAGGESQLALFRHITLVPHSCDHNVAYFDDHSAGLGRLYAIRDLRPGEFVSISYIGTSGCVRLWPRWHRQEYLLRGFGFRCQCARCEAGVDEAPTPRSRAVLRALRELEQEHGGGDFNELMPRAELHLQLCEGLSLEDDGPFHLACALDLLCRSYALLYRHDERHLLRALALLARKHRLLASHGNPMEDEGLMGVFFAGASALEGREGDSKTRLVLVRLWRQLGGQLGVILGHENSAYHDLCRVLGTPEGCPSIELIIQELAAVQACAVCGVAAVYGCQRCKQEVYCSAACQRAHWPVHRKTCLGLAA
mmetsp:Transcript_14584/g.41674  ORF Transcript_14584/g.41674 Transcript_14584/m.41674 type:complete len:414 (-) Transcript_14584:26-1267(-)